MTFFKLAIAASLLVSCYGDDQHDWTDIKTDTTTVCQAGQTRACTCKLGTPGQQYCHSDEHDYSPCACLDAGVGSGSDTGSGSGSSD